MTWSEAIYKAMSEQPDCKAHYVFLTNYIIAKGYYKCKGKTPMNTVYRILSKTDNYRYKKVAAGTFSIIPEVVAENEEIDVIQPMTWKNAIYKAMSEQPECKAHYKKLTEYIFKNGYRILTDKMKSPKRTVSSFLNAFDKDMYEKLGGGFYKLKIPHQVLEHQVLENTVESISELEVEPESEPESESDEYEIVFVEGEDYDYNGKTYIRINDTLYKNTEPDNIIDDIPLFHIKADGSVVPVPKPRT